ncbi:MAG: DUF58 domain-containing protein [Ilumatobacter sp.]|uniref:DUF58 domain-containing protein n=1 Tax=Ilumatobacter sp. TaxID=1967498 RepID=UPI003299EA8E
MTRYGVLAIVAGVVSLAIGRAFGVVELFVIGAGFLAAVVAAFLYVLVRTPRVAGVRTIRPTILVAGDTGRVDLELHHAGSLRSARFGLRERVGRVGTEDHVAELTVEPLAARAAANAGYQLPTSARGTISLGPLVAELRDPLGLLRRVRTVAGVDTVVVAPRAHLVDMPELGNGPLGRHLLAQARRLGPGEFHSLREYADGDEPRTIHWRASARSDKLLVKKNSVEGLRRMLVVLDSDLASYADPASFERAVTVAASLVRSAAHVDLVTRFVSGGVDLRGPDVGAETLRVLAAIQPGGDALPVLDRDPGEGVGLLVVVSGSMNGAGITAARSVLDPTQAIVPVTTDETSRALIGAAARTEAEFLSTWRHLVGASSGRRITSTARTTPNTEAPARPVGV